MNKNQKTPTEKDSPNSISWWLLLLACSVAVPWCFLTVLGLMRTSTATLAPVPFGWNRVIVVQLLAALPLSWLLGSLVSRLAFSRSFLGTALLVLSGFVMAWTTMTFGSLIAIWLEPHWFPTRAIVRGVWSFLLVLPWCLAARGQLPFSIRTNLRRDASVLNLALAVVILVVLPTVYCVHLEQGQIRHFNKLVSDFRRARALVTITRLADMGTQTPLYSTPNQGAQILADLAEAKQALQEDQQRTPSREELAEYLQISVEELREQMAMLKPHPPRAIRQAMESELARLGARLQEEMPPDATPQQRIRRAELLASYDDYAAALEVLGDLPQTSPTAAMLLGTILQYQERWSESTRFFQRSIELLDAVGYAEPAVDFFCSAVFSIAENHRQSGKYSEAEQVLWDGMTRAKTMAVDVTARFHYQLGHHYQLGGRPREALYHLELAAENPALAIRARPELRMLRTETPICLMRP